jgi:glycosyltransferase involved in cell wall biosynthesis
MRKKLGIEGDELIIGTACRLVPIKRIDVLLGAFRMVRDTHPNAVLVIGGTGPLSDELKSVAAGLGIESKVKFLGHRDDIHDVMSAFDLFVMTSTHEGVPMALLEALAFGVPAVVPAVGGIPEVCPKEGVTLYKQPSSAAVAASILKAVNGVGNGHAKGRPFRQFSVENTSSKTLEVYRSILR